MDDVWDDEPESQQQAELDREWAARRERLFNMGYREGLEEGKQVLLQKGFDQGFKDGMWAGLEWGRLRGTILTIEAFASQRPELSSFAAKIQALAADADVPPQKAMADVCGHVWETTASAYCTAQLTPSSGQPDSNKPQACSETEPSNASSIGAELPTTSVTRTIEAERGLSQKAGATTSHLATAVGSTVGDVGRVGEALAGLSLRGSTAGTDSGSAGGLASGGHTNTQSSDTAVLVADLKIRLKHLGFHADDCVPMNILPAQSS